MVYTLQQNLISYSRSLRHPLNSINTNYLTQWRYLCSCYSLMHIKSIMFSSICVIKHTCARNVLLIFPVGPFWTHFTYNPIPCLDRDNSAEKWKKKHCSRHAELDLTLECTAINSCLRIRNVIKWYAYFFMNNISDKHVCTARTALAVLENSYLYLRSSVVANVTSGSI